MIQRLYKHPVNLVGRWTECTTDPEWGCGHAGTDNTWPDANEIHRYWCYVDDNGVAGNNYTTCSPTCTNGTVTPHDEITETSTKRNAKVPLSEYTSNGTCEENNGFWNGTTCYQKLGLPEDCKSCDDGYILDGRKCTECAGQTQYKCKPSKCCVKKTECPSGQILVTNDDPVRNNDCEPCAGKTHYQCTPSQCCEKKTQCPPRQTLVTNEDPARNNHCEPFTATCEHGTPKTPDTTKVNGEDCASCHPWYFMNYGDVDEGDVCEPRDPGHTTTYNGKKSPTYRCTTDPEWGCGHAGTDNTWPGANGKHRYWCYLDQGGVAGSEYMTCSPTCTNGTVTSEDDIQENTIKHNAKMYMESSGKGTCEENNGFWNGTTCYHKLGLPEDCSSCDYGYVLDGRTCKLNTRRSYESYGAGSMSGSGSIRGASTAGMVSLATSAWDPDSSLTLDDFEWGSTGCCSDSLQKAIRELVREQPAIDGRSLTTITYHGGPLMQKSDNSLPKGAFVQILLNTYYQQLKFRVFFNTPPDGKGTPLQQTQLGTAYFGLTKHTS